LLRLWVGVLNLWRDRYQSGSRPTQLARKVRSAAVKGLMRGPLEGNAGHAAEIGERKLMARWLVDLIGKRVTRLGTVHAKTERDAIDAVTKRFGIRTSQPLLQGGGDEGR
jgi:hypothetical protein